MNREQQTLFAAYLEMTSAIGHLSVARRYVQDTLSPDELDGFDSLRKELEDSAASMQGRYRRPLPVESAVDPS